MPNAIRGETTLKAGEETYTLLCDINALCLAEEQLGMDIDMLLARYSGGTSTRLVRGLLWAALQAKHECTIEQAGNIITDAGFLSAKAALETALLLAMPAPEDKKPGKAPRKAKVGTG
ncbi:hypothetical protein [Croceicoccus sp. YJ47]|uniref:hypothetical protein n=1 Tax=Croceicoccus sp. YJ47 TaxID=2798724 RepID=UPI001924C26E|nr:hypothetical protein [Croceicoccus sp. YJ47]QQN73954.1 hypothetical protein JD971_14590 [Croceicoccus sp. YJ47]